MKKLSKIFAVLMTLSLLVGLFVTAIPVSAAVVPGPGANTWGQIKLPTLYPGSNVGTVDIASDGTILAAFYIDTDKPADGVPDSWGVLKSTDGGYTWTATKYVPNGDHISAIEASANWASDGTFFVATSGADLFRVDSTLMLPLLPAQDSEADAASTIYALDSWFDGTHIWLLAGTDVDALILEIAQPATNWLDLELAGDPDDDQDAYWVGFASDFATSNRFWCLTEGSDYQLTSTIIPGQWGTTIAPWDSGVSETHPWAVDVEEAPGYTNAAPMFYVALSDGSDGGNIFLVQANSVTASGMALWTTGDKDFGSVEVAGTSIIISSADSSGVFTSHNAGDTWIPATKQPSPSHGDRVRVEMWGPYDPDTGVVLAFGSGAGSAVSRSDDGGDTFNAIAMIDGCIDEIRDLGFSPMTASQPMLMITEDYTFGTYAVWRTADATSSAPVWERLSNSHTSWNNINYTDDGAAIILQDGDELWKSTNNGQTFLMWRTLPGAMGWVEDWIAPNGTTIYLVGSGGFYGTSSFGPAIFNPLSDLESIAMFGDTIIVGDDNGKVFISLDKGNTWSSAQTVAGAGVDVIVAFGPTGVPYFATSDSTVSTFSISSTGTVTTGSVATVKDSALATATAESFTGIWISPDNTLYALGGDGSSSIPGDLEIWGMIELDNDGSSGGSASGDGPVIAYGGTLDIEGDDSAASDTVSVYEPVLIVTAGSFGNEPVVVTDVDLEAITDSIVAGRVFVEDDATGTDTGYFDYVWLGLSGYTPGEVVDWTADSLDADAFDDDPVVPVMGVPFSIFNGTFADGDKVDPIDTIAFDVDDIIPTVIGGTVVVEGNSVVDIGMFDAQWIGDFGFTIGDLGDYVDLVPPPAYNTDLEVVRIDTPVAPTTDLFRLLLGESGNLWETEAKAGAMGLWGTSGSNILWTIVGGDEIWALEDLLSGPVSLLSPADGSTLVSSTKALLEWDAYDGATKYEGMYLDMDTAGATPVMFTTTKTSTNTGTFFEATGLIKNHDYCWKVRALVDSPFQSRWSATWGFFTHDALDTPENKVPLMGAQGYTLYPSFVWGAVTGADSYELEISSNPDFSGAVVVATDLTQYTQTTALQADTNYYWRVRAISDVGGVSAWCVSNFHTAAAQAPPVEVNVPPAQNITLTVPQPETPGYIWAIIAVGAILTIAVIVLIVRTRRVV
jgi:hypothetical protein